MAINHRPMMIVIVICATCDDGPSVNRSGPLSISWLHLIYILHTSNEHISASPIYFVWFSLHIRQFNHATQLHKSNGNSNDDDTVSCARDTSNRAHQISSKIWQTLTNLYNCVFDADNIVCTLHCLLDLQIENLIVTNNIEHATLQITATIITWLSLGSNNLQSAVWAIVIVLVLANQTTIIQLVTPCNHWYLYNTYSPVWGTSWPNQNRALKQHDENSNVITQSRSDKPINQLDWSNRIQ